MLLNDTIKHRKSPNPKTIKRERGFRKKVCKDTYFLKIKKIK